MLPEIPGGQSDEPFDVGTIELKVVAKLDPGEQSPDFEAKTLDGKPIKLSDYQRKFVLVDFWSSMYVPTPTDIQEMKAAFEAHGKEPRSS